MMTARHAIYVRKHVPATTTRRGLARKQAATLIALITMAVIGLICYDVRHFMAGGMTFYEALTTAVQFSGDGIFLAP
jgi:hypothetical protein